MKPASKRKRAFSLSIASTCALVGIGEIGQMGQVAHASTTFLGDPINYSFGTVQVQITTDGSGKITQIDTPQYSRSGANGSYANYAIPILVKEALAAQSATIQGVSGASYISRGWITSLASAIAKVGSVTTSTTPTPVVTPSKPAASATPVSPTTAPTIAPTIPAASGEHEGGEHEGGEHEGGEGGEEAPRPRPTPTPKAKPTAPAPAATPTATPTASPISPVAPIILKPGAGVIQKSITCVKGATKKVIKGIAPKCPPGFTLKKP